MAEQAQGTEYTLQGVMRFLQMEWHNHERARNSWDIERAEMKVKIAKQEGENRNAKRMNEVLEKQIKMLERALKNERVDKGGFVTDAKPVEEAPNELNGDASDPKLASKPPAPRQVHTHEAPDLEMDADRDKFKGYTHRISEELTYLLTTPSHPAPSHAISQAMQLQNVQYQEQHPSMEDAYMLQQQRHQQMQRHNPQPQQQHLSSYPNQNQVQSRYDGNSQQQLQQDHESSRVRQVLNTSFMSQPPQEVSNHVQKSEMMPFDEQVENVSHNYDSHGRSTENMATSATTEAVNPDPDAWDFDESTNNEETVPEVIQPPQSRRPDTDLFPNANLIPTKSPTRSPMSHRRKSSGSVGMLRRRSENGSVEAREAAANTVKNEAAQFKVRFALRGHLDVVRSVIFTGGGSPSEPEICTTGDDGTIKRWYIPASYGALPPSSQQLPQPLVDLDIQSYFTHRGHEGAVTCLAACPASPSFSTGGRVSGDGWVFSGGQDSTIRVWERGRVDPKATLDGHTDAIWALCVLPATFSTVFGSDHSSPAGGPDRILLASGSADQTIKIWAVSAPPQNAPQPARRGVGGSRRNSVTSGSSFPSSPQPSTASGTPFHYTLIHSIAWPRGSASSPTCIAPLGPLGETFVVSYADASVLIFDTRTGEEIIGMASGETYDGTSATGINSVVVASTSVQGLDQGNDLPGGGEDEGGVHGATGDRKSGGIEGVVISGHEDRFVRFFDANSGQCTYSMLAHPASIASLSLSPDGREMVSAGHDASLRFWSLEKRSCIQEITSHRLMRGEGVVCVVWSQDGKWVVSGGGDGVVKVFAR